MGDVGSGGEAVGERLAEGRAEQTRDRVQKRVVSFIRPGETRESESQVELGDETCAPLRRVDGASLLFCLAHPSPKLGACPSCFSQWVSPAGVVPCACGEGEREAVRVVSSEEGEERRRRDRVTSYTVKRERTSPRSVISVHEQLRDTGLLLTAWLV